MINITVKIIISIFFRISLINITLIEKLIMGGIPAKFIMIKIYIHFLKVLFWVASMDLNFSFSIVFVIPSTVVQYSSKKTKKILVFNATANSNQLRLNTEDRAKISNILFLFICEIAPIIIESKTNKSIILLYTKTVR